MSWQLILSTMTDKPKESHEPSDAEIEQKIRRRRKLSLAEAIGRSAGDLMKGASPVTRKRQAEFAIEELLDRNLSDPEGALAVVLLRQTRESSELLSDYDSPRTALETLVESILDSEAELARFVTKVDAEWGRIYSERPYFEVGDRPASPDDPYTRASVLQTLSDLLTSLRDSHD